MRAYLLKLLFTLSSAVTGLSHAQGVDENDLKVGFIFNFAKFVTLTSDSVPTMPKIRFCVWEKKTLGDSFTSLEKFDINGKQIESRIASSAAELRSCGVVYFSGEQLQDFLPYRQQLRSQGTLTVTEGSDDSILSFDRVDDKIRFRCNLYEAQLSGLRLSSQLVKLAHKIIESTSPGGEQ